MNRYARRLELASMALMLLGIAALCQPWVLFLHRYSVLTIMVGLLAFNVFARLKSPPEAAEPDAGGA